MSPLSADPLLWAQLATLAGLSAYGVHRYELAWRYLKHRSEPPLPSTPLKRLTSPLLGEAAEGGGSEPPFVLIQLPMFNERFVAERLIDATCAVQYPHHKLCIQVLDDSTDDSASLAEARVARWASRGYPIEYHHRRDRRGFKAGALDEGLLKAPHAELVAIFDADFIPTPDFLTRTVPFFEPAEVDLERAARGVGVVQARWDHLNRSDSWLTRAQAILLDGHFMIEHTARHRSGCFFNFNGTAGLWDKRCIEDAGGWQHDTLTEDLDLSYRAQLKGWRFVYLNDVTVPAELPQDMRAFKAQQHRWAKGSIQVARKLLPQLMRSELPTKVKREAWLHLTGNVAYLLMVALAVLTPLTIEARSRGDWGWLTFIELPVFLSATLSVLFFYGLSQRESSPHAWRRHLLTLPLVLALGIGLAVNNSKAALEALIGVQSPFVRTPKRGEAPALERSSVERLEGEGLKERAASKRYTSALDVTPLLELTLAAHFAYGLWRCVQAELWASIPLMLLFMVGFLLVGVGSLRR